jgi:hypothetical protein
MAAAAGIVPQSPCADSGRPNPEAAPSLRLAPAILGQLRAPIALRPSTSHRRIGRRRRRSREDPDSPGVQRPPARDRFGFCCASPESNACRRAIILLFRINVALTEESAMTRRPPPARKVGLTVDRALGRRLSIVAPGLDCAPCASIGAGPSPTPAPASVPGSPHAARPSPPAGAVSCPGGSDSLGAPLVLGGARSRADPAGAARARRPAAPNRRHFPIAH